MLHQNLGYLFLAFAATWAGFFAYLFFVHRLLADTRRRLSELEDRTAIGPVAPAADPADRNS
jgi:CcmD family protein